MEWGWFLLKASIGTGLFTVILWWVQSRDPRVAGLMLTFPAFNGLGLLAAESTNLPLMTQAMLPMIATNGVLCAAYILGYRGLVRFWRPAQRHALAALLLVVCLAAWGGMAYWLAPRLQEAPGTRFALLGLVYVLGASLITVRWLWCPSQGLPRARQGWGDVLKRNTGKVSGIFLLLLVVMLCARLGADAWAGRLSTLPVLPLYSLFVVALETRGTDPTPSHLDQLGSLVLAGPGVAITFVQGFAAYLHALDASPQSLAFVVQSLLGLILGWGACGVLIWAMVWGIRRLETWRLPGK